jgi:hypothetical protein
MLDTKYAGVVGALISLNQKKKVVERKFTSGDRLVFSGSDSESVSKVPRRRFQAEIARLLVNRQLGSMECMTEEILTFLNMTLFLGLICFTDGFVKYLSCRTVAL